MANVAIVGFGYWGKNLVRNFYNLPGCEIKTVCENNPAKQEEFKSRYPYIQLTAGYDEMLGNNEIDAVIIATPVDSHYKLAKAALNVGKHVLVEKPLANSFQKAGELVELAQKCKKILMVDNTFLYTGAVQHIKKVIDRGDIGKINYIDTIRINLGLFQHDVNVLWDLASHDISICSYLLDKKPSGVQAIGVSHTENNIENIAYLILKYENNTIAHFSCSWVSPVKIRQMLIGGDNKMILYNDNEITEKVKIYDTGYQAHTDEERTKILIDYRVGDIHVPKISIVEALALMAKDFINSINTGIKPLSDGALGLRVVEILEAAQLSIKQNGREIIL